MKTNRTLIEKVLTFFVDIFITVKAILLSVTHCNQCKHYGLNYH